MDERGGFVSGLLQCALVSRGEEAGAVDREKLLWLAGG